MESLHAFESESACVEKFYRNTSRSLFMVVKLGDSMESIKTLGILGLKLTRDSPDQWNLTGESPGYSSSSVRLIGDFPGYSIPRSEAY